MTNSVLTNSSALMALQNLNRTNERLTDVQSRINTGLKVQGAKDNASIWAIAQNQRADMGALEAVTTSLNRATSIADVSLAAGESISDLLIELKKIATAAADPSATDESRRAYNDEFQSLLTSITSFARNATFDGENILDNSQTTPLNFLADADASQPITIGRLNFTLEGLGLITPASADYDPGPPVVGTPAAPVNVLELGDAETTLGLVSTALAAVSTGLAQLGAQAKQIESHTIFVSKLRDALETGIGNLVDADMAKESARLQALQVQQQLGAQALSIANQAPQIILSLFRN